MEIGIIITSIILCAFFTGMKVAFISSNKIYLELEKKQYSFISNALTKITQKPSQFIAAMLIGNTLSLAVYGFFMSKLVVIGLSFLNWEFSYFIGLLIQIGIASLVILITAELLPGVFFQIHANYCIKLFALPAYFFYQLFYYFSSFLIWISSFILRVFFKIQGDQAQLFFSKVELENYITEQMSAVDDLEEMDSEIQIFKNALDFSSVKARDVMTPRTEIVAIDVLDSIENLKTLFIETGYSKIVVYQKSLDDSIGYVHSFDLFKKPQQIVEIVIPVEFIPETILAKEAMNVLTKKRKSVAVVLDEYGGTSGILTIEDIVEELFGEIEDEHDKEEQLIEESFNNGEYLFSTRLDIEYLNQKYKFEIPESDSYGTLGGFIVDFTKEIPKKGDKVSINKYHFLIKEATKKKIELVKMSIIEA